MRLFAFFSHQIARSTKLLTNGMYPLVAHPFRAKQDRTSRVTRAIVAVAARQQIVPESRRATNRFDSGAHFWEHCCAAFFRRFKLKLETNVLHFKAPIENKII